MRLTLPLLLSIAILSCAHDASAGASLYVDDAAITPAHRCQLESWVRAYRHGEELSTVPACNLGGTEFGIGVSRHFAPAAGPFLSPGIKRLFRDFDTHDWGIGVALGATWDGGRDRLDGWSLNVPVSVALAQDESAVLHANVGWNALRGVSGVVTGGLGVELAVAERWTLLGEGYGDRSGTLVSHLGLRRALGDSASLDLLLGHEDGDRHDRWVTLGLDVQLPE